MKQNQDKMKKWDVTVMYGRATHRAIVTASGCKHIKLHQILKAWVTKIVCLKWHHFIPVINADSDFFQQTFKKLTFITDIISYLSVKRLWICRTMRCIDLRLYCIVVYRTIYFHN